MKKLICVVALCLVSPLTFADEGSVQMVLDSVHSKGFVGCDNEIREAFKYSTVRHVETKMPFLVGDGINEKNNVALDDEIIVIIDWPGNTHYGSEGGILSKSFRKISKRCIAMDNFSVRTVLNRDCKQVAANTYGGTPTLVAETEAALWFLNAAASEGIGGADGVYTRLQGGGCREISLPIDFSQYRKR